MGLEPHADAKWTKRRGEVSASGTLRTSKCQGYQGGKKQLVDKYQLKSQRDNEKYSN